MLFILNIAFGAKTYRNGERRQHRRPRPDPRASIFSRILMGI